MSSEKRELRVIPSCYGPNSASNKQVSPVLLTEGDAVVSVQCPNINIRNGYCSVGLRRCVYLESGAINKQN